MPEWANSSSVTILIRFLPLTRALFLFVCAFDFAFSYGNDSSDALLLAFKDYHDFE